MSERWIETSIVVSVLLVLAMVVMHHFRPSLPLPSEPAIATGPCTTLSYAKCHICGSTYVRTIRKVSGPGCNDKAAYPANLITDNHEQVFVFRYGDGTTRKFTTCRTVVEEWWMNGKGKWEDGE